MSKQVDERIVSMQFDNRHFENNVQTSMSTLEKLKEKLNFKNYSNCFDGITKSAKNVDLECIGKSADTVGLRFNAMYTVADQALRNLTNSAMAAGKKIISALTLDPVKTGYNEYATQLQSVQTILGAVGHKGKTIDDVNAALDELNEYADQTIYNFTEMTRNIGLFTNAGVGLDESVAAIKGFSNAAAMAGTDSTRTAQAMYQLSQAMSSGTVKLMDWRSLETANITGERFRDTITMVAKNHGIAIDSMIKKEGSLRDTLKSGWLTADLMTEALEVYTASTEGLTEAQVEAQRETWRAKGYTDEQIESIFKLGTEATNAATQVRDFGQMWSVLQETAQSGWAQTWRLIFGDLYEAKALFTPLTNFFSNIIDKMSEARNKLLEGALGKTFTDLSNRIKNVTAPVQSAVDALKNYNEVVNKIIAGNFGNGAARWKKLTEAGYDWAHAQNLVNEKLGDSTRHATNYKQAQDEVANSQAKLTEADAKRLEQLTKLSNAELKQLKYNDEQISAIRDLQKEADKLGISVSDFVLQIDTLNGRTILLNSFKNIGQGIVTVFSSIGEAWSKIFPAMQSEQLYNIIAGFHKLSTHFIVGETTANNLTRTLKGLFAVLDIVLTIVSGPFKLAFKILGQLLGVMNMDFLSLTAIVGDFLVWIRDGIDSVLDFTSIFQKMAPYIRDGVSAFKDWIKEFTLFGKTPTEILTGLVDKIKSAASAFKDWIKEFTIFGKTPTEVIMGLVNSIQSGIPVVMTALRNWLSELRVFGKTPQDIIAGLVNGIQNGIPKVINAIVNLAKSLLEKFKAILGIHSPSKEFQEAGTDIIDGLFNGLSWGVSKIFEIITYICITIIDIIKSHNLGNVFAVAISTALTLGLIKIGGVLSGFSKTFGGFGELMDGIGDGFEAFGKGFKKMGTAAMIQSMAIAIGVLAASVAILALLPADKLWSSVGAITVLAGVVAGLAVVAEKLTKGGGKGGVKGGLMTLAGSLIGISAAILILSLALKALGSIDNMGTALTGLAGIVTGLAILILAFGNITSGPDGAKVIKAGGTILAISIAIGLLVGVIALASKLDAGTLIKGGAVVLALGAFISGLIWVLGKFGPKESVKVGGTILAIAISIGLLVGVIALASKLEKGALIKGGAVVLALGVFISGLLGVLAIISALSGGQLAKVGGSVLALSIAIGLLLGVVALASKMSVGEITKGLVVVGVLGAFIAGFLAALAVITKMGGGEMAKVGVTILALSVAIGVLAGVVVMLSLIDPAGLVKGLAVVTWLGLLMTLMINACKGVSKDSFKSLIVLTVAIAVMTAAIAALSLLDGGKLAGATAALSAVMLIFTLMIKVAGQAQASMGSLIVLTVAIGLIGGVLYLLAQLPIANALSAAISLSAVILSISVALNILKSVKLDMSFVGTLGALVVMCGLLVGLGWAISTIPDVSDKQATILTIVATITALSALVAVLSLIGKMGPITKMLSGIAGLTLMCGLLVGFGWALSTIPDVTSSTPTIIALTKIMILLTALLIPLAIIGPLAMSGVGALAALGGLILAFGVVAVAIGALMSKFPALESFVDKGIPILEKLAHGLGSVIGNLVSGLMTGMASGLPELGLMLSQFMGNAMVFITGVKMVDESVLTGVGILAKSILALTAADFIEGISSFLNGGTSFSTLGTELSAFMMNALPFIMASKLVDPASMEGVKTLAEAIMVLTKADVIDGLTSWFTGGASLTGFGEDLAAFAPYMKAYADAVAGIDGEAVRSSAEAAKNLAEAFVTFPEGLGEKGLADFASQLGSFGAALKAYSESVIGIDVEAINTSVTATNSLSEMASALPNMGGVVGWFMGDNDLAGFGEQLKAYGESLKSYSDTVSSGIDSEAIDASVTATNSLSEMAGALPNIGGMVSWFTGDNDLATFGEKIKSFGESLVTYSNTVTGLETEPIANSVTAAYSLSDLAKALPSDGGFWSWLKSDTVSLTDFGTDLVSFGGSMKSYSDAVAGINLSNMVSAVNGARLAADFIGGLVGLDTSGVASFSAAISDLANTSIDEFANAFSNSSETLKNAGVSMVETLLEGVKSEQKQFTDTGTKLIEEFSKNINKKKDTVLKAIKKILSDAVTEIRNYRSKFVDAGGYMIQGLAQGISNNASGAINAAAKVAKDALATAKKELEVKSPSRKFMELGKFVDQGLANGLQKYSYISNKASENLGLGVLNTFRDTLGIHSPATEMYEPGENVVEGLARGICDCETAETAMADKATSVSKTAKKSAEIVMDEAGHYIVQNIAAGIEADTSAEDAMEKKAQNIVNAFKTALDKIDLTADIEKLDLDIWKTTDGEGLDFGTIDNKDIDYLKNEVDRWTEKEKIAYDEYLENVKYIGEGYANSKEAQNKVLEAKKKWKEATLNKENAIDEYNTRKNAHDITILQKKNEDIKEAMENRDAIFELWEKTDGLKATDEEKTKEWFEYSTLKLNRLYRQLNNAMSIHEMMIANPMADEEELGKAYDDVMDLRTQIADELIARSDKRVEVAEKEIEAINYSKERINEEFELWSTVYGKDASDEEWDLVELTRLKSLLQYDVKDLQEAKEYYDLMVEIHGEKSDLAKEALKSITAAEKAKAETLNAIEAVHENAAERELEAFKKKQELARDIADSEYQLWESLYGEEAESGEKEAAKLSMLSKQLFAETELMNTARKEWSEAVDEYGEESNEAREAYKEYLQKQLDVSKLQNDITDLNESSASRQKKALTDYKDYMKKYEKYYLSTGLTKEDLERDAKLVSGYNPDKTVKKMVSDTKLALDNVQDSDEYKEVMNDFSDMGTSYAKAVNEGINNGTSVIEQTVITFSKGCVTKLEEYRDDWKDAGKYLVEGFATGIRANIQLATEAAAEVGSAATEAIKVELDEHSPSRVFASIGMYAVKGLANGLLDSSYMSNEAAAELGNSAIDNLKDTIAKISEVIDSDMDTQPTIRPVLDLSDVNSKAARLNTLFSHNKAMTISAGIARTNSEIQNGTNGPSVGGNTFQFTQNNYSPKALSRTEIYRQTKNQFSALKGALT